MLLRMGADGSEFDSSESNSGRFEYEGALREVVGDEEESDDAEDEDNEEDEEEGASEEDEEVVFDGQGTGSEEQLDGALFDSDEAFARALQDKDDRDTLARLMAQAGIHDCKFLLCLGGICSYSLFDICLLHRRCVLHIPAMMCWSWMCSYCSALQKLELM